MIIGHIVAGKRFGTNFIYGFHLYYEVMIWVILPKYAEASSTNYVLSFVIVLLQYIPKMFRCLPLIVGQTANDYIFESFVLNGHFVRSCWYLFGLQVLSTLMAYLDIKILFVISCIIAIVIDPLYFFAFAAHEEYKCLFFNHQLAIIIAIVRSVTDFIYLIHVILPFWLTYVASNTRAVYPGDLVIQPKKFYMSFLLDLYIFLPLSQVMIWVVLPKYAGASSTNYVLLLIIVLLQYIPKVIRCLPLIVGQNANDFIFKYFATDFLMFVLSGHFVGSCWYLFGLQRMNQCLSNACLETCPFIHCREIYKSRDSWFYLLNNSNVSACLTNDDKFNYGIYERVITLASEPSVITRYVHSLIWGVQQISIFVDILVPSYFEWEGLFLIVICALRMFFFIWIGVKIRRFRSCQL